MSLLEHVPGAPETWFGEFPLPARYTAGIAGELFLRALQEKGQILCSVCQDCEITYVPARSFCERCLAELTDHLDVGTTGVVETFTLLFEDLDGSPLEEPKLIAFIRIADGGLVHFLGDIEPEDVEMEMPVEAVFKPKAGREGSMLDIAYFKPAKG